jgi:sigma-54 dependent transcriptional regulator, acetoin dehydrogenase operon transcriptional activator AcoR
VDTVHTLEEPRSGQEGAVSQIGPVLVRLCCADDLAAPSGRWPLKGLRAVALGRARAPSSEVDAGSLKLGIPDGYASGSHALLEATAQGWTLRDLGSTNGTFLDGAKVPAGAAAPLREGALFEVGHTFWLFRSSARAGRPLSPLDTDEGRETLSPEWEEGLARVGQLARTLHPVLLSGESGVGKEVLAQQIHGLSGRPGRLVALNCAALPEALMEDELFGHARGAYSGAASERLGLLRAADGGTLLLDEVGDMPLSLQAKLLRVIEDHTVRPLGGEREVAVEVRVISATHRDLRQLASAGKFRSDLLARLGLLVVELPPLRRRREDLGILLRKLLTAAGQPLSQRRTTVEALRLLFLYSWPLNVRELRQAVLTGFDLAPAQAGGLRTLAPEHLPEALRSAPGASPEQGEDAAGLAPKRLLTPEEEALRERLVQSLLRHRGNAAAVARELGKARTQVQRWVARFGLQFEAFRRGRD